MVECLLPGSWQPEAEMFCMDATNWAVSGRRTC